MAIYALKANKDYARVAKPFLGNATPILTIPEAASQTFIKGAILKYSSGNAALGTITSGGGASANCDEAFGMAVEAGANNSSAAAANTQYVPLQPGIIFEMAVSGVDTTAANYTSKATDVGIAYGVDYSSTTKVFFVNKSQTTVADCSVLVMGLKDAASTVTGHVYVQFTNLTNYQPALLLT